jgi:phosphoribosylanthranilate isomerase
MNPSYLQPVIKICGLKDEATIAVAAGEGANLLGFVHFPKSPRHVELSAMPALFEATRKGGSKAVLLLVDPDEALLEEAVRLAPDFLQLHGNESTARVQEIKRLGIPLIKACGIAGKEDIAAARGYLPHSEHLLLDKKASCEAAPPGGNGQRFDWQLLAGLDPTIPFLLSGGLDAHTVGSAIALVQPQGVDVSSGLETRPGIKDAGLIRAFIRAAQKAFQERA